MQRVSANVRRPAVVAVLLVVILGAAVLVGFRIGGASAAPREQAAAECGPTWVTAWGTSPRAVYAPDAKHGSLDGRTLRLITRVQSDGDGVRIMLSNRYGKDPLTIGAATVGVARETPFVTPVAADLVAHRSVPVLFSGRPTTQIPPGQEVLSDPVTINVALHDPVAVSLFLPGPIYMVSEQDTAMQTSYLSGPGDFTADGTAAPFTKRLEGWPVLTGVEVHAPRPMSTVLLMGDSLAAGVGSALDANQRWSDALADKLTPLGGSARTTVINGGIAGNELLADGANSIGDAPGTRLRSDLPPGVTDVILEIGNNDIAKGKSAVEITDGLTRFARDVRARGINVFLTTVTPSTAPDYSGAAKDAVRRQVNDWVRSGGPEVSDGYFDLADVLVTRDQPNRIGDLLDSGDGIHLSAAGYRALARAVDSGKLTKPACS